MKFAALALDYDGTIAVDGVFDPAVREAVADARRRGIVAILATGRRLTDLHRVAGDLTCFDALVAENGAVPTPCVAPPAFPTKSSSTKPTIF
jgi:hydroxymethylpyrimidine pyrophosphatase-like HAD family hydrolase